ncbi:M16 family metallopeptidase [Georgenia thermotolerans]|uniref:Insulinase family protein n=2 Tax=Georgenia thermotolerans TaxID=527326 RepID=A0A7J5UKT3_9MICO|nr:pitrilysin family protein [Georgenia thermotolerans]KAE8762998.1 insulinase family protein [Georgenia thermotolerans]
MPQPLHLGPAGAPGTEIHTEQDGSVIRRSVLPGGIRVLTEAMPGQRSTAVGAWVAVGSRDETDGHFGSTHFLEHLLFKGTASRSALDIAEAFDAVGGEANAATGKEHTCYYARVLDADLPMAVDVIADMVTSSVIDAGELETERGVILEELAMNDDDPVDVAHERFTSVVLGDHPLGRPIGGTPETIRAVPRDAVVEHYRRTYVPHELVVTAAGSVDHDALCAQVLDAVRAGGWTLDPQAVPAARRTGAAELRGVVPGSGAVVVPGPESVPLPGEGRGVTVRRPTEQANVLLGGPGIAAGDERRYVLSVLTTVLGGGMSSRLFQEIREKRGLAYSTYAFASSYAEAGTFGLYAGCAPGNVTQVVELLTAEWDRLVRDGVGEDELRRSVGQLRGNLVLGLEDNGSRMSRLGRAEIVHGELTGLDELIEQISQVTAEQVRELAADLAAQPRSLVVVGPFDDDVAERLLGTRASA